VIDQAARLAKTAGDDRPIGLLRAEAHAALVLRPWDTTRPTMTGHLTLTAPLSALYRPDQATRIRHAGGNGSAGGDGRSACAGRSATGQSTPAVNGTPITAAHLRELLTHLGALGVQAPPGGSLAVALTDDDGALLATATTAELSRLAARGCPHHDDTAHGDADTAADGDCGCPVLGQPDEVPGYDRSAAQERFIRLRDRTCRHPGCSQPAGRTDLDHVVAYDCGGRTACDNLCCLCRSHHRLKTFARGWRFQLHPDGTLRVTTPSGVTRSTRPPGLREQPPLPPPEAIPPEDAPPF
jgi:hypothetical protein